MNQKTITEITSLFAELSAVRYIKTIYISGSAARKTNVKGSDIDINIIYDNILYDNINPNIIELMQKNITQAGAKRGYNLHLQPPKALSEFWNLIRSGEPWILTELEAAIVIYDPSELIEPLKYLLKNHQLYKKSERASLLIDRAKLNLREAENSLFTDSVFHLTDAAVTSTQAILMYFDKFAPINDLPPALEKFTAQGLITTEEHSFFCILLRLYNMDPQKRRNYCKKNNINLDLLIQGSLKYLERMEHLFELLELMQKKEQSASNYNTAITIMKNLTKNSESDEEKIILAFESEISKKNHYIPKAYVNTLKKIIDMKRLANEKRYTEISADDIQKTSASIKYLEKIVRNAK